MEDLKNSFHLLYYTCFVGSPTVIHSSDYNNVIVLSYTISSSRSMILIQEIQVESRSDEQSRHYNLFNEWEKFRGKRMDF